MMGDRETILCDAISLIDDEIIPEIMTLVLEKGNYDFRILDNGGARGQDLSVEGMQFYNNDKEPFRKALKNILRRSKGTTEKSALERAEQLLTDNGYSVEGEAEGGMPDRDGCIRWCISKTE